MDTDNFNSDFAQALFGCQLVEQEMKIYITEALDFIRYRLENRMQFQMRGEDYKKDSLGKLIPTFEKLTENGELVKQLKAFTPDRNLLVHKGIVTSQDEDGEFDASAADAIQPKLIAMVAEAERLCSAIREEKTKITFDYFDDVSEGIES